MLLCAVFLLVAGGPLMATTGCTHTAGHPIMFPPEVCGWKPAGPDEVYDAETLYDYIDGGAEVYRSFNVQHVFARRYAKNGAQDIIADVFDMGSSEDAFGAYHHDMREGQNAGIGQESEYLEGALAFWKGPYFVSIIAFDETEDSKQALLDLGRAIADAIRDEGSPPDMLKLLPQDRLIASQVRYLHTHASLNNYYYLADDNLLNLDKNTEGVLARYKPIDSEADDAPYVLLLVRYPSKAAARAALERFRRGYMIDADGEGLVRTENGKWAAAQIEDDFFIGVFDAPSITEAQRLMSDVTHKMGASKT